MKNIRLTTALLIAGGLSAQMRSIEAWVTTANRSSLFQRQAEAIGFRNRSGAAIVVDPSQAMQTIDGFGFALTGGSAELLTKMSSPARAKVLQQIFGSEGDHLGVRYLRVTIGASDLNSFVFSYDDLAQG